MTREPDEHNQGSSIAAARDDWKAFAALYRRHYGPVLRYCVHRLFERAVAEDVTSEVFLRVVEKFGSFHGDERDFRNWLYTIATNAVNAWLRASRRRARLLRETADEIAARDVDCPPPESDPDERLPRLKQAMLSLTPRDQALIALRYFEDMKWADIAAVLGGRPAGLRKQACRVLVRLRRAMATEGDTACRREV